jgi:hypothetical protein
MPHNNGAPTTSGPGTLAVCVRGTQHVGMSRPPSATRTPFSARSPPHSVHDHVGTSFGGVAVAQSAADVLLPARSLWWRLLSRLRARRRVRLVGYRVIRERMRGACGARAFQRAGRWASAYGSTCTSRSALRGVGGAHGSRGAATPSPSPRLFPMQHRRAAVARGAGVCVLRAPRLQAAW